MVLHQPTIPVPGANVAATLQQLHYKRYRVVNTTYSNCNRYQILKIIPQKSVKYKGALKNVHGHMTVF